MEEESILTQQYTELLYKVETLFREIIKINNNLNSLKSSLQENFLINNEFICQDELLEVINYTEIIVGELQYTVIPNIKRKSS